MIYFSKAFVQVILDRNLSIVGALTEVVPDSGRDQLGTKNSRLIRPLDVCLVQSLVPLFESQNQTPRLIKKIGKREIATAEQLGNMLRGGQTLVRVLVITGVSVFICIWTSLSYAPRSCASSCRHTVNWSPPST